MDAKLMRLRRVASGAAVAALLGLGVVGLVQAQQPSAPDGGAIEVSPPAAPVIAPPEETAPTPVEAAAAAAPATPGPEAKKPEPLAAVTAGGRPVVDAKAPAPPPPPKPVRSPTAVIQALDKVTAETMRFGAPIGKRVRYKNLVVTVRACETTGLDDAQPQSAAYVIIDSEPRDVSGRKRSKQVFKGWMYATSPGLNPLQHPVYDAWLIACSATAPPA